MNYNLAPLSSNHINVFCSYKTSNSSGVLSYSSKPSQVLTAAQFLQSQILVFRNKKAVLQQLFLKTNYLSETD